MSWDVLRFLLIFALAFSIANFLAIQLTTIYLHRCKTHGALILHPLLERSCKFLVSIHTSIVLKEWVGVHRIHHAHTDEPGDPHSPLIHGFTRVQFWNVRLYTRAAQDKQMIEKHTPDIPYTKADRWFYNHTVLVLGTGGSLYLYCLGLAGLVGFIVSGLLYVFLQSSTINGLGHWPSKIGSRNYTGTHAVSSYNLELPGVLNYLLSWYLGGENLHNNHHGDPRSAIFAHFPDKGEIDPAGAIIRFLKRIGLAKNVVRHRTDVIGV
ncbi:MAG: fatty acid desaturase [Patescibacteria group bacterium]